MKYLFYLICIPLLIISCQGGQNDYEFEDEYIYEEVEDEDFTASEFEIDIFYLGLTCDDYYASIDGYNVKNHVSYGDRLYFNIDNVKGFELIDGNLSADMMFLFLSEDGDTLEFTDYGDMDPLELYYDEGEDIDLNLNSNMIDPFISGDTYIFKAGLKDRISKNSLELQTTVEVDRNDYIMIDQRGLKCHDPYIYNPETYDFVTDNYIIKEVNYDFGFHGLRGFTEIDGQVELGMSVVIYDEYENESSDSGDLYENDGWFPTSTVFEEFTSSFVIYEHYDGELASVYVKIWDKNSDRYITIHSDFWLYE